MTDEALIERLRKAKGSEIMPTVLLGMSDAETTCLQAADRIEALIADLQIAVNAERERLVREVIKTLPGASRTVNFQTQEGDTWLNLVKVD